MGSGNSKADKNEALRLCKERRRYIKQAIDSRYALAAAHVSYVQSLRNIGIALGRFSEAEMLIESSVITSATELEKTPSQSSHPSPSPSHLGADVSDSPLENGSPISPVTASLSCMRAGNSAAVTVEVNPANGCSLEDDSLEMVMPPLPPPPPFASGSWDFFDPVDDCESFRFMGNNGVDVDFEDLRGWGEFRSKGIDHGDLEENNEFTNGTLWPESERKAIKVFDSRSARNYCRGSSMEHDMFLIGLGGNGGTRQTNDKEVEHNVNGPGETLGSEGTPEQSSSMRGKAMGEKDLSAEREDPSEFITHRAKDFLSSIKGIKHRFFRASEAGREVSRMLESNKIKVGYSEAEGGSSTLLAAFQPVCCRRKTALVSREPVQHATKVIHWKRLASSRSSSSRNPLTTADADDSGNDFIEEFCMIAGSHSSTLDRLYAWERKLYDEVKASESIRKEYDRKCDQLRHQFAKDLSTQVIDKTRAVVKDLHSRIRVALHSVNNISKRIEKMRDEELQPQLVELTQGLLRMWKAMLECHHSQYITISLAYHSSNSTDAPQGDTRRQIMAQLRQEIECFGVSFTDWVNSHASYLEALNGWLQNCIKEPQERSKNRYPFSPHQYLGFGPPIIVLCREWSAGIKALPAEELSTAIKSFLSDICHLMDDQANKLPKLDGSVDANNGEPGRKDGLNALTDEDTNDDVYSNLSCIQASLTRVLDRLNKFSEASVKMYEDVRQKGDGARIMYLKLQAN
ncbi:putative transcription factor [Hibiscus syriacus]|uniref:Transcription factor n=1 Tax=Hibiscus syriacus TaxID=106335 RepID=A0A6A3B2L3_HIBSY|nr:protein ALTERED PHOSPHATE STARVATION RESPONSE 1-like [Hibiscus syriacus]KAE8709605.1 putative transcription factor [Hibiscus syriacus]